MNEWIWYFKNDFMNHKVYRSLPFMIDFCEDWFYLSCCGGVETSMNSPIRFAKLCDLN